MNVGELIEELSKYPKDMPVVVKSRYSLDEYDDATHFRATKMVPSLEDGKKRGQYHYWPLNVCDCAPVIRRLQLCGDVGTTK